MDKFVYFKNAITVNMLESCECLVSAIKDSDGNRTLYFVALMEMKSAFGWSSFCEEKFFLDCFYFFRLLKKASSKSTADKTSFET